MIASDSGLILQVDASKAVVEEFRSGLHMQMAVAKIKQERINEDCRKMRARMLPGVGQLVGSVDPDIYFAFRHRFGKDCWRDPSFLKSCIKHGTLVQPKVEKNTCTIIRP